MPTTIVQLRIDASLRLLLSPRVRRLPLQVVSDGTASLGHLVSSVGLPLTEVGSLVVDGRAVEPSVRIPCGSVVDVRPPARPQALAGLPTFVLDVHLGSLARRLRLLGVDTAYSTDAADDVLVEIARRESRVLLTKDRGLLRRRAVLGRAAYVVGDGTDEQLADVLDRFEPPLAPYTRCVACNGAVRPVAKTDVASHLRPGTARSYDDFAGCMACGRVYWRGAHAHRLDAIVAGAVRNAVSAEDRPEPLRR